jgi:hypothetical protein
MGKLVGQKARPARVDELPQKLVRQYFESAPRVCEGPKRLPEAGGRRSRNGATFRPAARDSSAEKSTMNASNIQRAIQAHTVRLLGETAKKFWKREPRKASIHAG